MPPQSDAPILALAAGSRLPTLARADGRVVWRPQYTRNPVVLAVLHGMDCEACADYRRDLIAARPDFATWDGRLVVAAPQAEAMPGAAAATGEAVRKTGAPRAGAVPTGAVPTGAVTVPDTFGGAPRVIVADRFGDVYHVHGGGSAHALPEPRALEEWLRFIATQCPE